MADENQMRAPAQGSLERIAELQNEAGMYRSLYENAVEQCAKVAAKQVCGWINGEATTAVGQAYQRGCTDAAVAIRALAAPPPTAPVSGILNERSFTRAMEAYWAAPGGTDEGLKAAIIAYGQPAAAPVSFPKWCPGCSRDVDGICHHFNCAVGPNGLDAKLAIKPPAAPVETRPPGAGPAGATFGGFEPLTPHQPCSAGTGGEDWCEMGTDGWLTLKHRPAGNADLAIIEEFVRRNVGGQPALDAIARLRALPQGAPMTEKPRPADCLDPMGCLWRHVPTVPEIGLHLCGRFGCPHTTSAASALSRPHHQTQPNQEKDHG